MPNTATGSGSPAVLPFPQKSAIGAVDDADLLAGLNAICEALRDKAVMRPTEYAVFLRLLSRAYGGWEALKRTIEAACPHAPSPFDALTRRQQQAVLVFSDAVEAGEPPVTTTAERLSITKQAASQLLARARRRTDLTLVAPRLWSPTRSAIDKMIKALPRECARYGIEGCLRWTPDGSKPLCKTCHAAYPLSREYPPWLSEFIRRLDNEQYERAVNALYCEHYGEVSYEEYEALAEAS